MGWPKGVPRKQVVPAQNGTPAVVNPAVHYDEILAVRNLRNGRFKGLWELVSLDDQGIVKKVHTDANSRGMIITMMTRAVMKIVVQS